MHNPLTHGQVDKLKAAIQSHYVRFVSERTRGADVPSIARPYAESLFTRITTGSPIIVTDTPTGDGADTPQDMSYLRWLEETWLDTSTEVLENTLVRSNDKLLDWHIATQTAALFLKRAEPMPELLRAFGVSVLLGERTKPTSKTGHSTTKSRNDALASCVYWLMSNSEFGIRTNLGITTPISAYSNSDAAPDTPTAVDLVCAAINQPNFKKTNNVTGFPTEATIREAFKTMK